MITKASSVGKQKGVFELRREDVAKAPASGHWLNRLPGDSLAVICKDVFSSAEISAIASQIYALKESWIPAYGGEQFSVGRIWYAHVDDDKKSQYFQAAGESVRFIEMQFPSLYAKLIGIVSQLLNTDRVRLKEGWAGPGFVILPSGGPASLSGGGAHVDWEGLTKEQLADINLEAYSFIALMQKPVNGGGLQVWDRHLDQTAPESWLHAQLEGVDLGDVETALIDYQLGDLVAINSLSLHKICPFGGDRDRVSLTFHAARDHDGWYLWF
jgi:hypothetical protein